MSESRKHTRGQTNDYFIAYNTDTGQAIGRLRNLTPEGVMLISGDPVAVPTTIPCRMSLPQLIEGCREIYFAVESRWCRENTRGGWYEVGCCFQDVPEKSKRVIEVLVQEWMTFEDETNANAPALSRRRA